MMPDHGTRARYSRGCRCEPCRGANAAYDRALRAKAGLPDPKPAPVADPTAPKPHGRTEHRIEDLEFLLEAGEYPERAVERVGWTMNTAEKSMYRHGRGDLAARLRVKV